MSTINYVRGDATDPICKPAVIVHVCNDRGGWGRGFVLALSRRWPEPEASYRKLAAAGSVVLGTVDIVNVADDTYVCNMVAQAGYGRNNLALHKTSEPDTTPPIRYDALERCLSVANEFAAQINGSLHGPRFGAGLAGGDWAKIESIINDTVTVPVYIYDL